ncbi:hypothetical protein SSX86_009119 [Deinandra increscens subsp. villosa]|uniref:Pentatricopeptide repeat-containing protein n=1 Tax=Deinandra increscens subsp. villosa TaxID=3103831 RepID=A0AAP0DKD7_9ASTR
MWKFRRKLARSLFSLSNRSTFSSITCDSIILSTHIPFRPINPSKPLNNPSINRLINRSIRPPYFPNFFSSSSLSNSDSDEQSESESDDEKSDSPNESVGNHELETEVGLITDILRPPDRDYVTMRNNLEKCSLQISPELVTEVLSQVRNDWKPAFVFFKWAGNQPNYAHSIRQYHGMIAILAKMKRFETAWRLIGEMKEGGTNGGESMVTPHTLLIMIRRYSAVHDVTNAIKTFYAYKLFNFRVGIREFHDLLSALCRYKNVNEAEFLLKWNESVYPLTTKGFNIVLNGWCNIIGSVREGKRVWWEMCNRGIVRDVISYSTIITCYSKCNETREVIKIFNELKASRIRLDLKVYNGVIHVFCKSGRVEEARELLESMETKGVRPNAVTYNSIIMPLCKKGKIVDALKVFDEMLERGLSPTVPTYHAFFRASRTSGEAFSILQKMNRMGCCPNHDTYTMLIRKFCRWDEFGNVWKLWDEMISSGLDPDRSSYVALVNGLFLNRKLDEAYKYHVEMKSKGLAPEPEMEKTLETWMANKRMVEPSIIDSKTRV